MPDSNPQIYQIRLPVKDSARATAFYKLLPLKYLYDVKDVQYFQTGKIELLLDPHAVGTGLEITYWINEAIEDMCQKLTVAGASVFTQPEITSYFRDRERWQAMLIDTEGNRFGLVEDKPVDF